MWFTHISTSTAAIKWCHYTRLSKHCDFNTAHLRMLPLSCCASLHLHVSGEALSLCCLTELLSKQMRLLQTLRRLLCAELITGTSAASMATFVRLSFDHSHVQLSWICSTAVLMLLWLVVCVCMLFWGVCLLRACLSESIFVLRGIISKGLLPNQTNTELFDTFGCVAWKSLSPGLLGGCRKHTGFNLISTDFSLRCTLCTHIWGWTEMLQRNRFYSLGSLYSQIGANVSLKRQSSSVCRRG